MKARQMTLTASRAGDLQGVWTLVSKGEKREALKSRRLRSAKARLLQLCLLDDTTQPTHLLPAMQGGCDRSRISIHRHNTCPTRNARGSISRRKRASY